MRSPRAKKRKPMSSREIAEYMGGSKQHILDDAVQRAVREAIELNEFLDAQKKRRELEPAPRPVARKRRTA